MVIQRWLTGWGARPSLAVGWVLASVVGLVGACGNSSSSAAADDAADVPAQGEPGDDEAPAVDAPVQGEPGDADPAVGPPEQTESQRAALDAGKLQLQQWPEGVRLIGNAGAVMPGAGAVTVTNAETGEVAIASVAVDGSLLLVAPGDRNTVFFIDVDGDGVSDGRIPSLVDAATVRDGECNCGTARVGYFVEGRDEMWGTPAMPLGCFCSGDCQLAEQVPGSNRDGYVASACSEPAASMLRVSGCGMTTMFTDRGNYTGGSFTFDDASGELVGATRYSDIPWGSCALGDGAGWYAYDYVFGDVLVSPEDANELTVPCALTTTCRLCGSADDDIPACD